MPQLGAGLRARDAMVMARSMAQREERPGMASVAHWPA